MLSSLENKTETIYSLICDCKYSEVVNLLLNELSNSPQSRCILSLIAYCYYHLQNFVLSANYYEKLIKYYGYIEEYRVYYVQSLWKAGLYEEALRSSTSSYITNNKYQKQMLFIRASIKYEIDDINGSLSILSSVSDHDDDDIEYIIGRGCNLFKQDKYNE